MQIRDPGILRPPELTIFLELGLREKVLLDGFIEECANTHDLVL